jgi:Icc protein
MLVSNPRTRVERPDDPTSPIQTVQPLRRSEPVIVIAHVSDTHIDGSPHNSDRAARVFNYLNSLTHPIDVVLVTGDIADNGMAAEYEQANKLFVLPYPVLVCPGNHDVRAAFREVLLGDTRDAAPINRVHRLAGAVFALCDSTIPGRDDGFLADETITWLDGVLADTPTGTPAFICFHHPPLALGMPFIDAIRQSGEERLAEVISRRTGVIAILCGHAHAAAATTFAGLPVLVAPGVVSTLVLPWEPGDVVDYRLPPAIAFHILDDNRRLTTHYRFIV